MKEIKKSNRKEIIKIAKMYGLRIPLIIRIFGSVESIRSYVRRSL